MSTPGLAQIWSLDMAPPVEASLPPNFDIWVANFVLIYRVGGTVLATELDNIPDSETRLRDEGVVPFYSLVRDIFNTLKSSAHERGVAIPAFPDPPADWREELSTDYKALAAQFRPHLVEPARVMVDSAFGVWERDPKPHWTSRVAVDSVSLETFVRMAPAMGGMMGGSEWGSYTALLASDELKRVAAVINEEILRIRAQPGSGWDEEEAKRLVMEHLETTKGIMAVGT